MKRSPAQLVRHYPQQSSFNGPKHMNFTVTWNNHSQYFASRLMRYVFYLMLGIAPSWPLSACAAPRFCVATTPAPVLNSADMSGIFGGSNGRTLRTDSCGQVRELEFVAFPGTAFRIVAIVTGTRAPIYQVLTDDYPVSPGGSLYVDSRFVALRDSAPPPRLKKVPEKDEVIIRLIEALGTPYVWGGNLRDGIGALERLFYQGLFSDSERRKLTLAGVDCSGLLYEATSGWTPRNTSQLVGYGSGVKIQGKSPDEIATLIRPLDLIVWNGHVVIALDRDTVIESRLECGKPGHGGVIKTPLRQRLREIMRTRQPTDAWPTDGKKHNLFVLRRWL